MKLVSRLPLMLTALIGCSGQTGWEMRLEGVSLAEFMVEPLDADSNQCGLYAVEPLLTAARLPIRAYTKIREGKGGVVIFLNVLSARQTLQCVHSISFTVTAYHSIQLPHNKVAHLQEVVLWRGGKLISGSIGDGKRVTDSLEIIAKRFAADWLLANP